MHRNLFVGKTLTAEAEKEVVESKSSQILQNTRGTLTSKFDTHLVDVHYFLHFMLIYLHILLENQNCQN